MFLDKYLNEFYLDLIYSNYDNDYLNCLDENNFIQIYNIFKKYNFYFINDIVINYLEIFDCNPVYVENAIKEILKFYDIKEIGKNMTLLEKILDLAEK